MKTLPQINTAGLQKRLLTWYSRNRRDLPWRKTRDPYRIWVSEIMLQQTRVDTVIPYYYRFLKKFPTVKALASATLTDVLKVWENLGYYGRARSLHQAAGMISRTFEGRLPDQENELLRLPGIGPYTAAAILCFAFGKPVPALDGNLKRVLSRLFAIKDPLEHGTALNRLHDLASALIPPKKASAFNQALMDLGTALCTPRSPRCHECPLQAHCRAFQKGIQETLPVRKKRAPLPHREWIAALIRDTKGRYLIVRRPPAGLLGGLWKFPGGERARRESLEKAVTRTIQEELGIVVQPEKGLFSIKHAYTHFRITLHVWQCSPAKGKRMSPGGEEVRWVEKDRFSRLPFSRADRKVIESI